MQHQQHPVHPLQQVVVAPDLHLRAEGAAARTPEPRANNKLSPAPVLP